VLVVFCAFMLAEWPNMSAKGLIGKKPRVSQCVTLRQAVSVQTALALEQLEAEKAGVTASFAPTG